MIGSFDLHVLGTPPALVLSQDQTLHKNIDKSCYLATTKLNRFNEVDLIFVKFNVNFRHPLDAELK